MEAECTQLQVDGLKNKIDQKQQQLEAQENIAQLNEFLSRQMQSQNSHTNIIQGPQGTHATGGSRNAGIDREGTVEETMSQIKSNQPSGYRNRVSLRIPKEA